jgi:hypothetical protein
MSAESEHRCNQVNCTNRADYRFTWPGQNESWVCLVHAPWLRTVAASIGLPLQLIPLEPKETP